MTSRVGAFHHKHGSNVRLLENGTVAHRVESYNKAVVFTERPISVGAMYKVKLLDKGGGWAGSIVSHVMLIFSFIIILFFCCEIAFKRTNNRNSCGNNLLRPLFSLRKISGLKNSFVT